MDEHSAAAPAEPAAPPLVAAPSGLLAAHRGPASAPGPARCVAPVFAGLFASTRHTITQLLTALGAADADRGAWSRLFSVPRVDYAALTGRFLRETPAHAPADGPHMAAVDGVPTPRSGERTPGTGWPQCARTPAWRPGIHRAQRSPHPAALLPRSPGGYGRSVTAGGMRRRAAALADVWQRPDASEAAISATPSPGSRRRPGTTWRPATRGGRRRSRTVVPARARTAPEAAQEVSLVAGAVEAGGIAMAWEQPPSYLEAAEAAARWIRAAARPSAHGLTWLPEPDHPERRQTVSAPATLYSGGAGIVLFFLELAAATGDPAYLDDARRGADHLAATWREVLDAPPLAPLANANLDFAMGLAGTAFTLAHAWRATGAEAHRAAALAITGHIARAARPAGAGVTWVGGPTIGLGDGAIVLYLLWAAREFGDDALRDLARRAGERSLELARPDPRGGLRWASPDLAGVGMPPGAYLPNFELGTAGVAYVLARLHAETGEPRFLAAAREGARHVQALAAVRDDAALLHYREPDLTDLYYLGYCHGPVGTARLFYELGRLTGEAEYREWTERFARGIVRSGVPERQTPGLWNVVCQCCGTAGIADFFTSLWVATGRRDHLDYAKRVADQTISRASDLDGRGARWYQAWTRTQPWVVAAETGYMIGAAGVGAACLHLHLAERGRYQAILFPDNPFPRRAERAARAPAGG